MYLKMYIKNSWSNCLGRGKGMSKGVLFTVFFSLLFFHCHSARCIDISDTPMDTKVLTAPPNIMFVLDNSGSMDWEFMTVETQGTFNPPSSTPGCEYVFDDPGDHAYKMPDSNGDILLGDDRRYWKGQWSGYNRVYYNQSATYEPWPEMPDADTWKPVSDPWEIVDADGDELTDGVDNDGDGETDEVDEAGTGDDYVLDLTEIYVTVQSGSEQTIVVDNQDGAPAFTTTGTWNESGAAVEYNGSSFYTYDAGATATWTPTIPAAQAYEVWAFWTLSGFRDPAATYRVHHAGGDDDFVIDQNVDSGQWNLLGTFDFDAGVSGYVRVTSSGNVSQPASCSGSSDAVRFIVPGTVVPIDIRNAHYYTWDDADAGGDVDSGEVYLVNFVYDPVDALTDGLNNDGDGDTDEPCEGLKRIYYQFNDINLNDKVDDGELSEVPNLPDSVNPAIYDEDGVLVRYKTHEEDLRNFANWYSYFRKRELTAKAAVAGAIVEMDWAMIGFYSINSGLRQQVLPVNVESNYIIVDNLDSGFGTTGTWGESSADPEWDGSSLYTYDAGATGTWTPSIPQAGQYKVFAFWGSKSGWNRDPAATYTVHHAGGDTDFVVDQSENFGQWNLLGTFDFDAGVSGYVRVTASANVSEPAGCSGSADAVKFEPVSGGVIVDDTGELLHLLYAMQSSGGTPLRVALRDVGRYYHQDDGLSGISGAPNPLASAEDGGACQQCFAIVMTDGYWNGSSPGVGHQDQGEGSPYEDDYSDTLADVAMKYYKEDLSAGLDNVVPPNPCDPSDMQHMVTYTVSFGVTGTLTPLDSDGDGEADDPCFLSPTTPHPTWPNPTGGDPQKIDDLWHAAVNGRGEFFSASDPQELVESLASLLENLSSRLGSGASVSVNGEELTAESLLFQTSYISGDWTGDVTAFPVDPVTGEVLMEASDIVWQVSEQLQLTDPANRRIVTLDPILGGVPFEYATLTNHQKTCLDQDWGTDPALAQDIVEYLRGTEVAGLRPRVKKLGDIIHSAPRLEGDTIFTGGNDGMVHAFNAIDGTERFAYVPNLVFHNLKALTDLEYEHLFFVDSTPFVRGMDVDFGGGPERKVFLVGGLGKGGKGYYALDVTDADSIGPLSTEADVAAMVMWEFPDVGIQTDGVDNDSDGLTDEGRDGVDNDADGEIDELDEQEEDADHADLGYSFSQCPIVKSHATDHEWVVVFGNGYNSTNRRAVLFILDLLTGDVIRKIDTGDEGIGENGLSSPAVVDVDGDFVLDYVYAGDLNGNIWKFDVTSGDPDDWGVAYGVDVNGDGRIDYNDEGMPPAPSGDDARPLFQATDELGAGQPITVQPVVIAHPKKFEVGEEFREVGYLVVFGTGKYLGDTDRADTSTQSLYGIWDYGDDGDDGEFLGTIADRNTGVLTQPADTYLLK
ncbi:MAG: PilC/PilY family type IV pilus protein, partial [Thermodesulfobacteriota bacterium]|nr:PilC/PilY family type IV pilus protein [Thermodesulfobacteriota bacterium]